MPQDHRVQAQVQADTGGAPQTPAALTTNAGDPDIGELVLNFVELDDKADFLELWDAIQFNYGDGFDRQNLTVEDFNLLGAFITKFPVFQQQVDELREPTAICEQSSETDESQPDEPFWRLAERTFMYAYWHDALHQEDFERFVLNIGKHATFRRDYFRERRSQRARVAALIADEESDRRFEMNEDLIGSLMYEDCIRVFDADPRDMSEDAKANVVNAFKVLYDHPHFVFQMNERLRTIYGVADL
ncbi:Hypothetical predicted protein [Cloeon dipterum]|uniref:Uncharacterized protein n=1 Tax=Cloeon dipterum TaxID=197152 RepID=A0A8S1E338_9INSE|nr:Hypothetical predicted protein [Cloeon dipterum]